jgi:hypothetical protein
MKFIRTSFVGLEGRVVRFTLAKQFDDKKKLTVQDEGSDFYIEASRAGVRVKGDMRIDDFMHLDPFAKAITDAWKEHKKLIPQISTTLSGH